MRFLLASTFAATLAVTGTVAAFPQEPSQAGVANNNVPRPLEGIEIADKRGADLPQGLHFTNQDGKDVTLGSYLNDGKPVVLVMAYYECPMLCTFVLNGLNA